MSTWLTTRVHTPKPLTRKAAVQGLGSGGITALIQIIIGDLVPLKDRGSFNGIMALYGVFPSSGSIILINVTVLLELAVVVAR